jgi:hypothetical protein
MLTVSIAISLFYRRPEDSMGAHLARKRLLNDRTLGRRHKRRRAGLASESAGSGLLFQKVGSCRRSSGTSMTLRIEFSVGISHSVDAAEPCLLDTDGPPNFVLVADHGLAGSRKS